MARLGIVVAPLALALWVWALVTVLTSREDDVRLLPKWAWLVVVLLFPVVGSVVWLACGRPRAARPRAGERSQPAFPEYDRPGRMAATDSAADEAFLRQVRARAEEQRRRAAAERRAAEAVPPAAETTSAADDPTEDGPDEPAAYPHGP